MGVMFKLHPSHLWEGWPESVIHLSKPQSSYSSYGGAWGLWKVFENCLKDRQSQGNHPRLCAISDHIICIVSVWFRCMLYRPWDLMNTSLWRLTFVHISKKNQSRTFLWEIYLHYLLLYICMYVSVHEGRCLWRPEKSIRSLKLEFSGSQQNLFPQSEKQAGRLRRNTALVPCLSLWGGEHHVRKSLSDLKFQRENCLSGGAAWQPATGVVEGTGGRENEQEVGQDYIFSKPIPVTYLPQQGHTL